MKKILFSALAFLLLISNNLIAQQSFNDDKISVKTEIKKLEDKVNDNFYSYYKFDITNKTNSEQKISIDFIYHDGKQERKRSEGNANLTYTLKPKETIKGDLAKYYDLTLFKNFDIGNSGVKSSEIEFKLIEITVKYL